jgi:cell division protease FtsH
MEGGGRRFSEQTAREIDLAVKDLVDQAYLRAKSILEERRKELEDLAKLLLEKETLTAAELPEPAPLPEAA